MRRLSQKAIDDFKQVYLEERGIELNDDEAHFMALQLLELAVIVLKKE